MMRFFLCCLLLSLLACQGQQRDPQTAALPQAERIAGLDVDVYHVSDRTNADGPKVLAVVAHPDDECAFAASMYKITTYLNGAVDIAMITNGEGGFKYSTLAESMYGRPLTEEEIGRMNLPAIRTREFIAGCRIMRIRDTFMFMEKDHRYTRDINEILGADAAVWDLERINSGLRHIINRGDYDFIFVHMPVPTTHAHHSAATILTLRAVAKLPPAQRPVIMGSRSYTQGIELEPFTGLEAFPETTLMDAEPLVFNRLQPFGYKERLNYKIIVNWVIAEHKSQGTMQLLMHKGDQEWYYPFALNHDQARAKAAALFERLAEPQFESKTYGYGGGTERKP